MNLLFTDTKEDHLVSTRSQFISKGLPLVQDAFQIRSLVQKVATCIREPVATSPNLKSSVKWSLIPPFKTPEITLWFYFGIFFSPIHYVWEERSMRDWNFALPQVKCTQPDPIGADSNPKCIPSLVWRRFKTKLLEKFMDKPALQLISLEYFWSWSGVGWEEMPPLPKPWGCTHSSAVQWPPGNGSASLPFQASLWRPLNTKHYCLVVWYYHAMLPCYHATTMLFLWLTYPGNSENRPGHLHGNSGNSIFLEVPGSHPMNQSLTLCVSNQTITHITIKMRPNYQEKLMDIHDSQLVTWESFKGSL